ncbi:Dot [Drosophila busckii]|uniref:Dot n=1 Tax=Drosophila busckii TaxID=30019 RepID=A0A0M4EPP5_DROBS|nr:Dot [Drosophila busckii]
MELKLISCCLLSCLAAAYAGNILAVFPHDGYSHFKVVTPVLEELARRGHQLTVISFVNNTAANYEQLLLATEAEQATTINREYLNGMQTGRSLKNMFVEYFDLFKGAQTNCERLFASGYVQQVLQRHQRQPYELLLTEYFSSDCQLALGKLLGLPIIGLSTCALMPYHYDRIDLPDTPSHIQSQYVGYAQRLSWFERLENFIQAKSLKLLYAHHTNRADNALIKRYLHLDMDVAAVAREQTAFIWVNQHYSHLGSRPRTPQLLEIGGVHITEQAKQQLPTHIAKFLQQSPQGVIFISWGSQVLASSIDQHKLQSMLQVLSAQPLNVIWKWEADKLPLMNNEKFLFVKWAPQLALLAQAEVKIFWTHAGLLGMTEALHCGKPMLMTPIYGDQFLNAHAAQTRGVGLILSYEDIKAAQLKTKLAALSKPE